MVVTAPLAGNSLSRVAQTVQQHLDAGNLELAGCLVDEMRLRWPDRVNTESARGALAFRLKDYPAAVAAFRRAIAVQRAAGRAVGVDSLHNLGSALDDLGEKAEAQACYRQVLALMPTHLAALTQLGALLTAQGQFDEALDLRHRALQVAPERAYSYYALGSTLLEIGDLVGALPWLEKAIKLDPGLAEAHFAMAVCALKAGDFATGWDEFEWRWKTPQANGGWPPFRQPLWTGEPLGQRILLIWGEQGLGDNVQFLRYLAELRQRWPQAGLAYWCPQTLLPLVAAFAEHHQVALLPSELAHPSRVQGHDIHVPLMSLPRLLGVRLEDASTWSWPAQYLTPPADRVARWGYLLQARCPRLPGRLRVGLVWSGAKDFLRAQRRNMTLAELAPWLNVPGLDWVSLQVGEAAAELSGTPWAGRLIDLTPQIADFADTAALATHLDLVLAVDTGTAHVAAAAGCRVWLLSRFDGCWRWLQDRADNPWYPRVQVFRQPHPLDWGPVVQEVVQALSQLEKKNA